GLRAVAASGIEIGSHGFSHRPLPTVDKDEFDRELHGSAAKLEQAGLPRPRAFAYPHGEWSPEIAAAVRDAGYAVAFSVSPGIVRRGADHYTLPRVEVLASDTPRRLRLKLAAADWPQRRRKRVLRLMRVRSFEQ